MVFNELSAKVVAKILLETGAVKLSPENPFTWASGIKSPIYCDNRTLLSFPEIRTIFANEFCKLIKDKYTNCTALAGVATGAIALTAIVADKLKLPMIYIRPEPKKHGLGNQIEGKITPSKYVVIEDLISTGGSSLKALEALKNHGSEVLGMAAIFTYGFETAAQNFKKSDCLLYTLCDYQKLLETAVENKLLNENYLLTLSDWRNNPETWEKK